MHRSLKCWAGRLAPLALGAAMLAVLASPAEAGAEAWRGDGWQGRGGDLWYVGKKHKKHKKHNRGYYGDDWYAYGHDWHGGEHHDWHGGPHFGPHSRPHWDPLYGWHAGPHYGPHTEYHHDWHRGGHHDWY